MVDLYGLYIAIVFLWRFIIRPWVVPLLFGTLYSLIALCVTRKKNFTQALFPRCLFTVTINGLSERGNTQCKSDSALCEAKTICGTTLPWVTALALFYESVHTLTESKKKTITQRRFSQISVSLAYHRQIGSISTNHSPPAWRKEGLKVTLVAVIGGFRSDLSITRKTDGNLGNFSAGVLFSKVTKTVVKPQTRQKLT